jgi:hypothetical protein
MCSVLSLWMCPGLFAAPSPVVHCKLRVHVHNVNSAASVHWHSCLCNVNCLQNLDSTVGWLLPKFVKDKVALAMRYGMGALFGAVTDNV